MANISATFAVISMKSFAIESASIPMLSPPLIGLMNRGKRSGTEALEGCSPGTLVKYSAVTIPAFFMMLLAIKNNSLTC